MITLIQWVLFIIAILSAIFSVAFSILSRSSKDHRRRGLLTARMNISMGLMLVTIASIQIVLFEKSTVRIIVAVVFFLLGFFNMFAGFRNHAAFNRSHHR